MRIVVLCFALGIACCFAANSLVTVYDKVPPLIEDGWTVTASPPSGVTPNVAPDGGFFPVSSFSPVTTISQHGEAGGMSISATVSVFTGVMVFNFRSLIHTFMQQQ